MGMLRAALLVALALATLVAAPVPAEPAAVEIVDGLISADFDATPVAEAMDAIRQATGVEIVVPASASGKAVTLSVRRLPLERFVRRLLERLDLGGFVIVYESAGAVSRILVVEKAAPGVAEPPGAVKPGAVKSGAGVTGPPPGDPVHVPPREPPVYTPPATPPRYTPPATPPVYVPSAAPPVYVPSPTPPVVPPPGGIQPSRPGS